MMQIRVWIWLGALGVAAWAQTGSVEGEVRNTVTHLGIQGATVALWTQDGTHYAARTDSAGRFRITGMKEGEFSAGFAKDGFLEADRTPPSPKLRVVAGEKAIRVDGELIPLASIRGRVLDADGQPLSKVSVSVEPGFHGEMPTRNDGSFSFDQLLPGAYRILAKPAAASARPQSGARTELVSTYYPSAMDSAQAAAIDVRAGAALDGLDIRLRTAPVFRVRGMVVDEIGKPLVRATVRMQAVEGTGAQGMTSIVGGVRFYTAGSKLGGQVATTTAINEVFEFASVRAGEWRVSASSTSRDVTAHRDIIQTGGRSVTVARFDVDDLEIRLAMPFDLVVAEDWGGQPPSPRGRGTGLLLIPQDAQPGAFAARQPDGSLRFERVSPGPYRFFQLPLSVCGYVPVAVLLGDRDVTGQSVELTRASPPLRVVYRTVAGGVRGVVEKGAGAVLLVRGESRSGDLWMSTDVGAGGTFELRGLIPGDYAVAAFDRMDPAGLWDSGVSSAITTAATRVRINEGSLAQVELRVNTWPR